MIVFCSKCGSKNKGDFCRNCGQTLPNFKELELSKQNKKKISVLSTTNFILTSAASLFCSFFAIYLLLNNLVEWNFISTAFLIFGVVFIASAMLSIYSKFYLKQTDADLIEKKSENILSADTNELLPEADFSKNVPASVVEHTTRELKTKVLNKREN